MVFLATIGMGLIQPLLGVYCAQAHSHQGVFALLRSKSAKRFLELPPAKQKAQWEVPKNSGEINHK